MTRAVAHGAAVLLLLGSSATPSDLFAPGRTAAPGETVTIPLEFFPDDSPTSALFVEVRLDAPLRLDALASSSDTLLLAGKELRIAPVSAENIRAAIVGLNQNRLRNGSVGDLVVTVPSDMPEGEYLVRLTAAGAGPDARPAAVTAHHVRINVQASPGGRRLDGVRHGASLLQTPLAPDLIVSIFGEGFGEDSTVLIGGVPAPLLFLSDRQINAMVPHEIGTGVAQIEVSTGNSVPLRTELPIASAAPGVFTANSSGTGSAAALNEDSSPNSAENPATRGSVISLFLTGAGPADVAAGQDGINAGAGRLLLPVAAEIAGLSAPVEYAGPAPGLLSSVAQLNVRIPETALTGSAVPMRIRVGEVLTQANVTISIRE